MCTLENKYSVIWIFNKSHVQSSAETSASLNDSSIESQRAKRDLMMGARF